MKPLDEIKVLSGIPLTEGKMPPRNKETIHKSDRGTDFILAPVKVRSEYADGKETITWKSVKKGSSMDNDWLVKTRGSGKPTAILSYDEGDKTWMLKRLKGNTVVPSIAAEAPSIAKVLDHA